MLKDKKILIVDDDAEYKKEISASLQDRGFIVYSSSNIADFLQALDLYQPDVAIIDKELDGEDGFDLIHEVRLHPTFRTLPIIVVTGKATMENKRQAILMGADDLMRKPVSSEDLELAILSNLRRSHSFRGSESLIQFQGIEVDLRSHIVKIEGKLVQLTRTEYQIFVELVSKRGEIVSREQLSNRFLSFRNSSSRTLDVHINSLRKKIHDHSSSIKTIRNRGYMFHV